LILKRNCQLIENLYHNKEGHAKLTPEKFVTAFQVLKVASVIGESFTRKQVIATSESLTDSAAHSEDVTEILNELEVRGLIELVYDDGGGDSFYRFQVLFLRETLFQLQMFEEQRKVGSPVGVHIDTGDALASH
jgi:hypothetical protein